MALRNGIQSAAHPEDFVPALTHEKGTSARFSALVPRHALSRLLPAMVPALGLWWGAACSATDGATGAGGAATSVSPGAPVPTVGAAVPADVVMAPPGTPMVPVKGGVVGVPSTAATSPSLSPGVGEAPPEFVPPPATLRRLTVREYQNSVRELLGVDPPDPDALAPDDTLGSFKSVGAVRVAMSEAAASKFEQASYQLSRAVFEDATARTQLVGCEPATIDDPCVGEFLTRFARRTYRRPATEAELLGLAGVARAVSAEADVWTGLSYSVAAMLQSPNFLYRVELGEEPVGGAPWRRYNAWELASRLSFLLTASTPDDELLAAAESGVLETPEGLEQQFNRLVQGPNASDAVMGYFNQRFNFEAVSEVSKELAVFPKFDSELTRAMRRELELLVSDGIWERNQSLRELLLSPRTFVNPILAEFYGLPAPPNDEWVAVERSADDPRTGLLGAAGLLALSSNENETSPTKRGRFIFERLLCGHIPEPPPGVIAKLPEGDSAVPLTMRQRLAANLPAVPCGGCHQFMDPLGLSLEQFDGLGAFRETDQGLALDLSGEINGVKFEGMKGLATTLAQSDQLRSCTVRRFYEYAFGRDAEREDRATLADLDVAFAAGSEKYPELLKALVLHDAFRLASPAK